MKRRAHRLAMTVAAYITAAAIIGLAAGAAVSIYALAMNLLLPSSL